MTTWTAFSTAFNHKIERLVCLGLGNFAQSQHLSSGISAKNQLLFLLCLVKHFQVSQVLVFDPIHTDSEKKILTQLNLDSGCQNPEGHYQYPEATFYFLPHCPKQLLNNLLWSNWHQLQKIVIAGNSITNLALNSTHNQLSELQLVNSSLDLLSEIPIKNSFQFKDIFNNLSLHRFQIPQDFQAKISLKKPQYSADCEFIQNQDVNTSRAKEAGQ